MDRRRLCEDGYRCAERDDDREVPTPLVPRTARTAAIDEHGAAVGLGMQEMSGSV
jgi:hypothetical protein